MIDTMPGIANLRGPVRGIVALRVAAARIFLLAILCLMLDSQSLTLSFNITFSNIFLLLCLILVFIINVLDKSRSRVRRVPARLPSLAFAGIMLISGLATIFWAKYPSVVIRQLITLLGCILVLFLTQYFVDHNISLDKIIKNFVIGGLICAVLGIAQSVMASYFGIFIGKIYTTLGGDQLRMARACSTWNDPNIYGLFLVPVIPLSMALMKNRLLKAAVVLVTGFGMALSYSRTAWVALATALALYSVTHALVLPAKYRLKKLFYVGLVMVGFVSLMLGGKFITGRIWDSIVNLNPESYYGRLEISQYGLAALKDSGYMGIGPGNFVPETNLLTHNSFLSIAIEYGAIGFLAWVLLLAYVLILGIRAILKKRNTLSTSIHVGVIASAAGLMVGSLAIEMHMVKFFWLFLAMLVALGITSKKSKEQRSLIMKERSQAQFEPHVLARVGTTR